MAKKPDGSTKFTELRRVQMELEEARDRYVDLYDGAPTGYLTLNPKGMILEANLPACTLLGINRKDLLGKPVVGFVAAKDQVTFHCHIREIFKAGARQACEVDLAQQDDARSRSSSNRWPFRMRQGSIPMCSPLCWILRNAQAQRRRCSSTNMGLNNKGGWRSVNGSAMTSTTGFCGPSRR